MWLIIMHVSVESNMIFYFTLGISNVIRLLDWWELSTLPVIVLITNHMLFLWVYWMMLMGLFSSCFLLDMMSMILLQRQVMSRILVLILPLLIISFTSFFTSWWTIRHCDTINIFTLIIISTDKFFLIIHCNTWTSLVLSIAIPFNFSLSWWSCICHRNIRSTR